MSILLLTNTIGNAATSLHHSTVSSGFDATSYISGPRSTLVQHDAATSAYAGYNCAAISVSHVVVCRADKFKNSLYSTNVQVQYGTANTTDSTTTASSMTLLGYRNQDWVKTIARTDTRFRVLFSSSANQVYLYSKVYFSNAFSFNTDSQLRSSSYTILEEGTNTNVKPLLGDQRYETELMFSLTWSNVSMSKIKEFKSLPIFWPFFLYDENGDLWDHRLEHVLIAEPWREVRRGTNSYDITIIFHRLRHYTN